MRSFVICVKLLILVNNYILDAGSLVGWVSLGAHVNGSSIFFFYVCHCEQITVWMQLDIS